MSFSNEVSKKNILIVGGPYNKDPQYPKSGGITRVIDNFTSSNFFISKFEYDIFDDSNYSSSTLEIIISSLVSFLRLSKKLKLQTYDLVLLYCNSISFSFIKKFIVCLLIKLSNTKLYVRYGGSQSVDFFSKNYLRFLFVLFFDIQTGILVQGATGKSFYKKFKSTKIFTESNFVRDSYISKQRKSEYSDPIEVLLVAGPDYKRKGFILSLEAISLFKSFPSLNFKVIECTKLSLEEIRLRGLFNKIEKYGRLTYSEMESLLENSDVLILPSYKEGLPNIILEAMAKGLVIITTSVGSISDVVNDGENGYVVNVGNKFHLYEILKSLDKKKLEMTKISYNNVSKIQNSYSEGVVLPKMIDFISK